MNSNQQPLFGGQSPFVGFGGNILGMNVPQVLEGINSPQELIELLAIANEFKKSGADIKSLQEKASRVDLMQMQLDKVLEANGNLAGRIAQLEDELEGGYTPPMFPADFFHYYSNNPLLSNDAQELIDEAAETELGEGQFRCLTLGDLAVIRMNDGENIITLVTRDFYEASETLGVGEDIPGLGGCLGMECSDPDCCTCG